MNNPIKIGPVLQKKGSHHPIIPIVPARTIRAKQTGQGVCVDDTPLSAVPSFKIEAPHS